jgi:hypothetical protein
MNSLNFKLETLLTGRWLTGRGLSAAAGLWLTLAGSQVAAMSRAHRSRLCSNFTAMKLKIRNPILVLTFYHLCYENRANVISYNLF